MPNERRLRELAALSQIYGQTQAPVQAQQEAKMRAALAILNLQQQQAQARQEQQLKQQELAQRGHIAEQGLSGDILRGLQNDPQQGQLAASYAAQLDPRFAQAQQQVQQQKTQAGIQQTAPVLQALYQANAQDPAKLQSALSAMQPAVPADVWNGLPWDQLNQGLPGTPAPSAFSVMRDPGLAGPSAIDQAVGDAGQLAGNIGATALEKLQTLLSPVTYPFRALNTARKTPAGQPIPSTPFWR